MAPAKTKDKIGHVLGGARRIAHSKVKTGCITCRARRVKCDEGKPKCLRCHKYGTECGGYQSTNRGASPRNNFRTIRVRALVPKPPYPSNGGPLFQFPTVGLFQSNLEQRYFDIFSTRIARQLCPYFDAERWTLTILQACMSHPSIRCAAIAIGALGKTNEIARLCKRPVTGERILMDVKHVVGSGTIDTKKMINQANEHHQHALEFYGKAINGMRREMKGFYQDIRVSLIICIIISCFEGIHGNHRSAAAQLQAGLAIVENFHSQVKSSPILHPKGYSSPCPDVVDDFLVQSFGRIDIQSMSVFDPRPVEVHSTLKCEGKETIAAMPKIIQSIEEARIYHDLITRRIMHFNSSIHTPRSRPVGSGDAQKPWPTLQLLPQGINPNHNPIPWVDLKISLEEIDSTISSTKLKNEKDMLSRELRSWVEASHLLLQARMKMKSQDTIPAHILRIAALSNEISLGAAFSITESAYDIFLPHFRLIVQHASQVLALQQEHFARFHCHSGAPGPVDIHFSFEIGLIPSLYIVLIKCRHGPTRRQALALLRKYPHREGVWDTASSSGLGSWVMELEEEGARNYYAAQTCTFIPAAVHSMESCKDGEANHSTSTMAAPVTETSDPDSLSIPEVVRVRQARMRFDLLERRAVLFGVQMDLNSGAYIEKTGIYEW